MPPYFRDRSERCVYLGFYSMNKISNDTKNVASGNASHIRRLWCNNFCSVLFANKNIFECFDRQKPFCLTHFSARRHMHHHFGPADDIFFFFLLWHCCVRAYKRANYVIHRRDKEIENGERVGNRARDSEYIDDGNAYFAFSLRCVCVGFPCSCTVVFGARFTYKVVAGNYAKLFAVEWGAVSPCCDSVLVCCSCESKVG